ncbi:hypothetical protein MP228_002525 [Amoeboaphelidium protococcarum]|nr:hypothetical protein MP228_002525 [Amoeboaphelidium protococcarum]
MSSFFGFDTSSVPRSSSQQQQQSSSANDASLREYDDEHNDETFGVSVSDLKQDFQFGAPVKVEDHGHVSAAAHGGASGITSGNNNKRVTVEELEAEMLGLKTSAAASSVQDSALSAADIEAQMLAEVASTAPSESAATDDIEGGTYADATSSDQQQQQNYDGLMLDYEKDLILKIQLSQLASDPTFEIDFYNKAFNSMVQNAAKQNPNLVIDQDLEALKSKNEDELKSIMKEVRLHTLQKIAKSSAAQSSGSPALGRAMLNSLRRPKQLMNVDLKEEEVKDGAQLDPKRLPSADRLVPENGVLSDSDNAQQSVFKVLSCIERCHMTLIALNDLYQEFQKDGPADNPRKQEERNAKYSGHVKSLWTLLHQITRDSHEVDKVDLNDLLKQFPPPHGISLFCSYGKGRRVIGNFLRFLPREQILLLLKSVMLSLKTIVLPQNGDAFLILRELEEYVNFVVFPFANVIGDVDLAYVNDVCGSLLQTGDIVSIGRTKPGLLFITLLLSRVQIIIQKVEEGSYKVPQADLDTWNNSLFPTLFAAFQTRYVSLFPPAQILPPLFQSQSLFGGEQNAGGARRPSAQSQPIQVDDTYVWQFLAALSPACDEEQHRVLVTELRDKIFEVIGRQGDQGKEKVNIFLNTLGLNASQLQ